MDAIYRKQRHFYDLTRKYYLLGRDRLIRELAPPSGGSVIEIGCGTGRNLIVAARTWPEARFYGIDISEAMLETARGNVVKAGLSDRITLAQGDATAFDAQALFGRARFDRVFQSYTLSMIPDWLGAIREGASKVAPGGRLDIVDFGQQEGLPRAFHRLLLAWLAKFDVTPRATLPNAMEEIAAVEGLKATFRPLYRGYAWSARLSRVVVSSGRGKDQSYPDGIDFSWLASDRDGHVAVFVTGGKAPVPAAAFSREDVLPEDHEELLWAMPEICRARTLASSYDKADFVGLATRGLTVFDWTDMHRTAASYVNAYEVVARPDSLITIDDLPEKLRPVARALAFTDVRFSETASFDPRTWMETIEAL